MRRSRAALVLAATLAAAVALPSAPTLAQPGAWENPSGGPELPVTFDTRDGPVTLRAALAATEESRVRGLSGHALRPGEAVLYDFRTTQTVRMWTRDDRVPLDMAFVGADGIVAYLRSNLPPGSERPIPSRVPVRYVLELPAGSIANLGLRVGDAVRFGRAAAPPGPSATEAPPAPRAAPPEPPVAEAPANPAPTPEAAPAPRDETPPAPPQADEGRSDRL